MHLHSVERIFDSAEGLALLERDELFQLPLEKSLGCKHGQI